MPQGGFRILGLDWVIVHVNDLHWLEGLLWWVLIVFVRVRIVNRRHVVDVIVIVGIMRWPLLAFGSSENDAPLLSRWADEVIHMTCMYPPPHVCPEILKSEYSSTVTA